MAGAADVAVDLELVLAVDVSGSMDDDEHALQRSGYVQAFRHPAVINTIQSGYLGRIAVTYYEWAGPDSQVITVPWSLIDGPAAAEVFADVLAKQPRAYIRGTSISGGLLYGATLFDANGFAGPRRVIDISGDGANNMGVPVEAARDSVVAMGITVNGLPFMLKRYWDDDAPLDVYYKDCVIGGRGAFVVPVDAPIHMARAIRRKLILEIAEPSQLMILAAMKAQLKKADCFIGEKRRLMWDDSLLVLPERFRSPPP
ncbi:MAG: DUF1194 domain-containing protein [Rhodospirillaceae bacterium]